MVCVVVLIMQPATGFVVENLCCVAVICAREQLDELLSRLMDHITDPAEVDLAPQASADLNTVSDVNICARACSFSIAFSMHHKLKCGCCLIAGRADASEARDECRVREECSDSRVSGVRVRQADRVTNRGRHKRLGWIRINM